MGNKNQTENSSRTSDAQGKRSNPFAGQAKEGIVLDREESPVNGADQRYANTGSQSSSPFRVRTRTLRGNWVLPAVLGVGVPLFLIAGIFIFGIFIALLILATVLRAIFGGSRRSSSSIQVFRV